MEVTTNILSPSCLQESLLMKTKWVFFIHYKIGRSMKVGAKIACSLLITHWNPCWKALILEKISEKLLKGPWESLFFISLSKERAKYSLTIESI